MGSAEQGGLHRRGTAEALGARSQVVRGFDHVFERRQTDDLKGATGADRLRRDRLGSYLSGRGYPMTKGPDRIRRR